jgi:hypothetical protein
METIEDGKKVEVHYMGVTKNVYSLICENCNLDLPSWEKLPTEKDLTELFTHKGEQKKRPAGKKSKPLKDSKRCSKDSTKGTTAKRAEGNQNAILCYGCGHELGDMVVKSPATGNKYCSISCMAYVEPDQKPDDPGLELAPQDEIDKKVKGAKN